MLRKCLQIVSSLYVPVLVSGLRLATWNLRFDSQPNNITVQQSLDSLPDPLQNFTFLQKTTEQPWSTRRIGVAEHLLSKGVELIGFQEALVRQVNDLAELLGDGWDWIGVGRDNGVTAGEYAAVFYDKASLTLLSNDSFWLSNTPFEPSKFPGAGSFRICTAARFKHTSGTEFSLLNTHLDDQSNDQRVLAASMLLMRARYEAVTHNTSVLVMGDFNSPPTGSSSGAYNIITGAADPVAVNATFAAKYEVDELPDFVGVDLRGIAPRRSVSKNFATFTGFSTPANASLWTRIDFIYGGSNGGWNADAYKVDAALWDDGTLLSDHRPVFADITI